MMTDASNLDASQPNIIVVTMDSVRADYFDRVGSTEAIDGFHGVRFSNAYANAPYTPASIPSFLTSRLPLADGHIMHRDVQLLPNLLRDAGYTTVAAHNNAQINRFDIDQAFDIVVDRSAAATENESGESLGQSVRRIGGRFLELFSKSTELKKIADHYLTDFELRTRIPSEPHPPDESVVNGLTALEDNISEPFFLWVHLMDTHHPYVFDPSDYEAIAGESFDPHRYYRLLERAMLDISVGDWRRSLSSSQQQVIKDAYAASIHNACRTISTILSRFKTDNTLTVISSDHGEELWERGYFGHAAAPSKPRRMSLYEEMIRVPLLIDGIDSTTNTIDTPVSLVDVLPTCLDVVGIDAPDSLHGRSLAHPAQLPDGPDARPVIAHATEPGDPDTYYQRSGAQTLGAVRLGRYKYMWQDDESEVLFDLETDPDESHDCSSDHPDVVSDYREILFESLNPEQNTGDIGDLDLEIEQQLQELGYLE